LKILEVTQTYLWGEDGKLDLDSSTAGESLGLKVTLEPLDGADETLITKEIHLNPNLVLEDGINYLGQRRVELERGGRTSVEVDACGQNAVIGEERRKSQFYKRTCNYHVVGRKNSKNTL
jgi:hypothetical protein